MELRSCPVEGMGVSLGFWRGRRVFLTGHTGFKGSWLSLMLARLEAKVSGYALAPEDGLNLYDSAGVAKHVDSRLADLRDSTALTGAVLENEPEVVFHLAAQALVLPSYEAPVDTFATNVMGTVHLLEAVARCRSVRAVIIVTSDKVYRNREQIWSYRENDELGGRDPYSASKACAEIVTSAYRESFLKKRGIAVATVRAGNVIGGGDWARDRIVPDFVRAAMKGSTLTVRNPRSTRPWQHVLEPLLGYIALAQRLHEEGSHWEGAWNFGPSVEAVQPVSRLVGDLAALWGNGATWHHQPIEQAHEASLLTLDSTKARHHLGWEPRLGYGEGLKSTVAWYKRILNGDDAGLVTLSQIDSYLELTR